MTKSILDMMEPFPSVEFLKPTVDISLYEKMMKIDPNAARQFIQTRLDNLNNQIVPIKEEIKQLNAIMSYDKDREILKCYNKSVKINPGKRTHGFQSIMGKFVDEYMSEGRFTTMQFYEKLKAHGHNYEEKSVRTALFRLKNRGVLSQPYRGVFEKAKG